MRHETTFSDEEAYDYDRIKIFWQRKWLVVAEHLGAAYCRQHRVKGSNVVTSTDYKAGRTPQHNPGLIGYDGHTFNLGVYRTVQIKRHHLEFVNKSTQQKVLIMSRDGVDWIVKVQSKTPPGAMLQVLTTNEIVKALKVIGINEVFTEGRGSIS